MAIPFSAQRAMIDALDKAAIAYGLALVEYQQAVLNGGDEERVMRQALHDAHDRLNLRAKDLAKG